MSKIWPAWGRAVRVMTILTFAELALGAAEADRPAEWSAGLLHQILTAETPARPPAPPPGAAAEMALRTYRLNHLRVGQAGKSHNVLTILGALLPAGSTLNPDVPANSLHILTTAAAHQAIWDYLSAVDVAEPAAAAANAAVPDEVRSALVKLAEADDRSAKLLVAVGALKSDFSREIAQIDARQRQQTLRLLMGGSAIALLLAVTVGWVIRRRAAPDRASSPDEAVVLAPDQITTALAPVHEKMRSDMLGLLNEVAIKLQAQHQEQQRLVREQQQQIENARLALADERRQFISEAGTMVVQAVERVDATTAKLAQQQDKVAELVQELQDTVRELDATKDDLRHKKVELEHERAKIAALSILLEEGGTVSSPNDAEDGNGSRPTPAPVRVPNANGTSGPNGFVSCTHPSQITPTEGATTPRAVLPSTPQYQFLPPDHPES